MRLSKSIFTSLARLLNLTNLASSSIPLAGSGPSFVHPVQGGSERPPIPIGLDLQETVVYQSINEEVRLRKGRAL